MTCRMNWLTDEDTPRIGDRSSILVIAPCMTMMQENNDYMINLPACKDTFKLQLWLYNSLPTLSIDVTFELFWPINWTKELTLVTLWVAMQCVYKIINNNLWYRTAINCHISEFYGNLCSHGICINRSVNGRCFVHGKPKILKWSEDITCE